VSKSPAIKEEIGIQERRKYPRIKTAVQVEFRSEGTGLVTQAKTSDISCGGCYIESDCPLTEGAKVGVTLWLGKESLITGGVVASHNSRSGNVIRFVDMSVQDLNRLNHFLQSALR
jgi:hypothetical protein